MYENKREISVKVDIGGKEVDLIVNLDKLLEAYALEVNDLIRSMKLQNIQTGVYKRMTFDTVYDTYLEYRRRYGLKDNNKDEELKLELKKELERVGLSIEKEGRYEYIEKY